MSYELLPAGDYLAVAVASEGPDGPGLIHLDVTKNGFHRFVVRFSILEPAQYKGRTVTWYASLSTAQPKNPEAKPPCVHTLKGLRAMGFTGNDVGQAKFQELDSTVRVAVEITEYQGKSSNRIAWVNPAAPMISVNAPDEATQRTLFAELNSYLADTPSEVRRPAQRRTAPVADDGELPF